MLLVWADMVDYALLNPESGERSGVHGGHSVQEQGFLKRAWLFFDQPCSCESNECVCTQSARLVGLEPKQKSTGKSHFPFHFVSLHTQQKTIR